MFNLKFKTMKRMFYLSIIGVFLLLSCSKKDGVKPRNEDLKHTITFKIGLPSGDPVIYGTRATIQNDFEKNVSKLDIYQFGVGDEGKFEGAYVAKLVPSGAGYDVSIPVIGLGNKQFFFVANNIGSNNGGVTSIDNLVVGSMKAKDFKKVVTKTLTSTKLLGTPLMMTATIPSLNITASTSDQAVELVRTMSRIDIKNFEPLLTVTRVRLEKLYDRSYMLHQAVGSQKPAGTTLIAQEQTIPTSVTPTGSNAAIEFNNMPAVGGFGKYQFYKHVFYPMVSDEETTEANAPLMIIEGTLFKGDPDRETKVVYKKALKVEGQSKFLGFKRNTLYTLVIEKAIKGEITATIRTDKWNEESLEAPLEAKIPTPTGIYDSELSRRGEVAFSSGTVRINKNYTSAFYVSVSANTEWEVFPEGALTVPTNGVMSNWLNAEPVDTYWGNTYDSNIVKRGLKLTAKANATGVDRTIRLILRSKADNNKQYILTVTQTK